VSTQGPSGTSSADPTALRVYVRVTRDMDQELLAFARGPLRAAMDDFRAACPDAARTITDLDVLIEQLARRGLRLSDMVERVAADFEAAGQGPDLPALLRAEVAGDLGTLIAEPANTGDPAAVLASLPVELPRTPLELPDQGARDLTGDVLGGLWDEVSGTVEGLVHASLHPMDAARGLLGMLENPGEALRAMIDWEDLESGHPGRWAGHMLPGVLLGAVTDGAGFFIRAGGHQGARPGSALWRSVDGLLRCRVLQGLPRGDR
jgi:hypothetical protein